jgi:hypothetical protein
MSAKQTGLVWELNLPHNEAWVLMAMADHADHEGRDLLRCFDGRLLLEHLGELILDQLHPLLDRADLPLSGPNEGADPGSALCCC